MTKRKGSSAVQALSVHQHIDRMLRGGLTQAEISRALIMSQNNISYHMNGNCKCKAPRYVYVPESWFRCRKCDGGWNANNGCEHSWYLDFSNGR